MKKTELIFYRCLPCLFVLFLLSTVSVHAETSHEHDRPLPVSSQLDLHQVLEATYLRNPRLQVIQARLKHLDAESNTLSSLWADDPSFNISHFNDELMDSNGFREWEVGLQLPVWLPGQKQARLQTLEQRRAVIDTSVSALKLELAGIVRELLWQVALSENNLSAAEKEWQTFQKLEKDVSKRVELGDLATSDLLLAQQETLAKESAYRLAEQEYTHAQHRYDMITGLKRLPASFNEHAVDDIEITTNHPLLKHSQEQVNRDISAREQVEIEKRGNPTLFLGTRHERGFSSNPYANSIGVSISVPLGLSSHTEKKLTAAGVTLSETKSNMELLYRELNIAIQDASRELEAITNQLRFARMQQELSQKHLALSRKSFALGQSSLFELIRIQAQAFAVERNMQKVQLEVGLYTARLNQAKGIIP